jgi:hypothetical protein
MSVSMLETYNRERLGRRNILEGMGEMVQNRHLLYLVRGKP